MDLMTTKNTRTAFNEVVLNFTESGFRQVEEFCFAYSATNIGDTIVVVNGHKLFPSSAPATIVGDTVSIGSPMGEVFKGNLKIVFDALTMGADPNVEITQLYYTN